MPNGAAVVYNTWIVKHPAPTWHRINRARHHRGDTGMHAIRFLTRCLMSAIVLFLIVTSVLMIRYHFNNSRTPSKVGDLWKNPIVARTSYSQGGGALSLKGGVAWINSGPISLSELRGKIVLLDFWTFCCINCHHILPDLAKLEAKYKDELVVIGVHSAKFEAERDTENIRRKVAEYRIKHPVVNDANMTIWKHFGVNSWPTLILIDANGHYVDRAMGEGNFDAIDRTIGELVEMHKAKGELNLTPLNFTTEMERPTTGPLLYPGKVVADAAGKRLFIADTGHNRIIQTGSDGENTVTIGSGEEGFDNGDWKKATFNRPQGMFLSDETLFVADTENHAIRAIDLKAGNVTTIAGIGKQAARVFPAGSSGPASTTPLCSPWDVIQIRGDKALYIAMAGPHQIWKLDIAGGVISVFAGSGRENIVDGTAASANFAQPSGLATDGENLFVADSEVSGVRVITGIQNPRGPAVQTIVGTGLFDFDDIDGRGTTVRLQHCLGLAYANDHLYIADTYNNKIKICEPRIRSVHTFVGTRKAGDGENPPHFYEPGGLSAAGSKLYVADTNNHKIKIVDLKTKAVSTLKFDDLSPPRLAPRRPSFPNATTISVPAIEVSPAKSITLAVSIPLAKGFKFNEETPLLYLVETPEKEGILSPDVSPSGEKVSPPKTEFKITVPLAKTPEAGEKIDLKVSLKTFVCSEPSSLCRIRSLIWDVPITFSASGSDDPISLTDKEK
jgi:DNA-binding beta-propeller fold protein YncE